MLAIFLKNSPPPPLIQKGGGGTDNKDSVVLYLLNILVYVYIFTMYLCRTEGHMVGAHAKTFFRDYFD